MSVFLGLVFLLCLPEGTKVLSQLGGDDFPAQFHILGLRVGMQGYNLRVAVQNWALILPLWIHQVSNVPGALGGLLCPQTVSCCLVSFAFTSY